MFMCVCARVRVPTLDGNTYISLESWNEEERECAHFLTGAALIELEWVSSCELEWVCLCVCVEVCVCAYTYTMGVMG